MSIWLSYLSWMLLNIPNVIGWTQLSIAGSLLWFVAEVFFFYVGSLFSWHLQRDKDSGVMQSSLLLGRVFGSRPWPRFSVCQMAMIERSSRAQGRIEGFMSRLLVCASATLLGWDIYCTGTTVTSGDRDLKSIIHHRTTTILLLYHHEWIIVI